MDMWEPYVNSVRAHLADAEEKLVFDRSTSSATLARRLTRSASRRTARSPPTATRAEPSRFEVPVAVLRGEPPRETPRTFRRSTRCGSEPVALGRSKRTCATSGSTAQATGKQALEALVLLA